MSKVFLFFFFPAQEVSKSDLHLCLIFNNCNYGGFPFKKLLRFYFHWKKKSILKVLPLHTSLCILVSIFPEDKFTKMEISIQKLGGLNTLFPIMYWQISFQTFCSSYSQSHSKSCFLKAFLSLFTFRNKASWAGFHCWSILSTLWDIPVHGL